MLAAACADERGRDTGSLPADPVCRESQTLIVAMTANMEDVCGFGEAIFYKAHLWFLDETMGVKYFYARIMLFSSCFDGGNVFIR